MLRLHLGVHKTASTHLQRVLSDTFRDDDRVMYIGPSEFRKFTKWKKGENCFDVDYSRAYLEKNSSVAENLILSEENICGDTFDAFDNDRLYENISQRLNSLSEFFNAFEEIEIFVTIRNPATYLPSVYCEALRWRAYRPFSDLYHGKHNQSWVPVIKDILQALPGRKINVMAYENYREDLTNILKMMGAVTPVALKSERVVRPSFVSRSIKVMEPISRYIPKRIQPQFLFIVDFFLRKVDAKKFQPFSRDEVDVLSTRYRRDIEELSQLTNINLVSRF